VRSSVANTDTNADPGGRRGTGRLAAFVLLFVLPFSLRLFPIEHGLPRNYVPDTHVVRNALGMARDKNPIPQVNQYSSYPYLTSYLLVPAYAAQYAAGRVSGAWNGSGAFARHALEHPEDVYFTARLVVALLGAFTVWATFRAARAAGLRSGAWVAAWLVATACLHTHFSVQERPWVPLAFFMALSAWGAAAYAARGDRRALLAAAAFAGLAFATHQIGLFVAGLIALAWLVGADSGADRGPDPVGAMPRRRLTTLFATGAVFVLFAIPLGHPYLLRYGFTSSHDVVGGEAGAQLGGVSIGGQRLLLRFDPDAATSVLSSFLSYDPVLVLLGAAGIVLALRRRALWPIAMFTLVWGVFFALYHNARVRYYMPIEAFLALPAGLLVERVWSHRGLRIGIVLVLAFPLVQVLRFDSVLERADTRALGEQRLAALPEGSRVAIDRYGPDVALDLASLELLAEIRGGRGEQLRSREAHRRELIVHEVPGTPTGIDAVRVEELLRFDEQKGDVFVREELTELGDAPGEVLRTLGVTHFLLVDKRPGDDEPNLLHDLVEGLDPVWIISPARGSTVPRECVLPMEMRSPLTELWTIDRPGPRLELYALPR